MTARIEDPIRRAWREEIAQLTDEYGEGRQDHLLAYALCGSSV